ncbi:DUF2066 domain-containing protein [Endozoicomonas ascidiicola]|uniref:DUF2066 domain-containing protein n=1 Tax=Endozoicomonas ascidiicola TaxID=1698521 RepID=UPI000AD0A6F4|nr:DUF2066 domain-containing protein [Endozoicomonas ascidiicola]
MPAAVQCQATQTGTTSVTIQHVFLFMANALRGRYLLPMLLALSVMALSSVTQAAVVKGLYRHEVPIAGQDGTQRAEAMSQALSDVLVKVAGQRGVLTNIYIRNALSKPETYIREFGFRTDDTSTNRQKYFQATFDELAVNQLLEQAGVPIWGKNRPSTLMWLAIEDRGLRTLVSSADELPRVFGQAFSQRGLPSLFPLMDFEDEAAISAVDVWGGFSGKILEASKRYGSQSILSGRLAEDNGRYYGRLNLTFRGNTQSAAIQGLNSQGVAQTASDLVGSVLSQHYAVNTSDASSKVNLTVENVSTLDDYATLVKYLERVNAVRAVDVENVRGSVISLELTIDGSESQLADALALGRNLEPVSLVSQDVNDPLSEITAMTYRWTGRQ